MLAALMSPAAAPPPAAPGHLAGAAAPAAAGAAAPSFRHEPVLLAEVLSYVPPGVRLAVDCTLGAGGHARALLERFPEAKLFGCDRDPDALAAARDSLAPYAPRVLLKHLPFSELSHHVLVESVDFLLADLGVSSPQLDEAARGFSFTRDGPLDMRMDPTRGGRTAAELVNRARPEELLRLFYELGEERFAPRIVRAIASARAAEPIASTGTLARIVAEAVPQRFHRPGFHPATQVFQALRMAVNEELGELERLLKLIPGLLAPGGRAALIAFHSLEDRRVKEAFRVWEQPCTCPPDLPRCVCGKVPLGRRLTRKPVQAGADETRRNPRARSAKLRVFEKAPPPAGERP